MTLFLELSKCDYVSRRELCITRPAEKSVLLSGLFYKILIYIYEEFRCKSL